MRPTTRRREARVLRTAAGFAREHQDRDDPRDGEGHAGGPADRRRVFDAHGEILGFQTKNQLDPTEDRFYVPGDTRRLFDIDRQTFGIAICHEGWRYPETVSWAAARGAKVVFHPQHTGSDRAASA